MKNVIMIPNCQSTFLVENTFEWNHCKKQWGNGHISHCLTDLVKIWSQTWSICAVVSETIAKSNEEMVIWVGIFKELDQKHCFSRCCAKDLAKQGSEFFKLRKNWTRTLHRSVTASNYITWKITGICTHLGKFILMKEMWIGILNQFKNGCNDCGACFSLK